MAALPIHGTQQLTRLTTAAKLARIRPSVAVEVDSPGVIRTERLIIRPLVSSDREAYIDAVRASRKELDQFCPLHRDDELDDELFDRQLQLGRAATATGRAWRCIAELRAQRGRIVGAFNLNDISYGLDSRAEANVWVRTNDYGNAFAREAMSAVLAHAFGPRWAGRPGEGMRLAGLGLSRVDGLIAPENAASLRMTKRLGFIPDPHRGPERLVLRGREVEHLPYVLFAPVTGMVELKPRVPAGVSLSKSIQSLLSIEMRAAVRGD